MSDILRLNLLKHKGESTDGTYLWWGNQNPAPSRYGKSRKDKDVAFSFKGRVNSINWSTARGQEPEKRRRNKIMSVQKKKKNEALSLRRRLGMEMIAEFKCENCCHSERQMWFL